MNFKLLAVLWGAGCIVSLGLACVFAGCAGSYVPPVSVSGGFFGATVTVAEPGFTVPAKVAPTATVTQPTLLVPASEAIAVNVSAPVTTSSGATTIVPVVVAPVTSPVLAVPSVGSVSL